LRRVEASDVHGWCSVDGESALSRARELDKGRANEGDLPPLYGLPIAVKDTISVRDMPCTGGSRVLEGYVPSFDAPCVERLKAAGAVVIGKTNCDEFAMGSTTETSFFEQTVNPFDLSRTPGGSSGGSSAVVSNGEVPAALGSDTGGSIRQPASWCGVVGLKPTYGRVSRRGLLAYGSSTDCIGPMCTSVEDCAILLEAMAGHDPLDVSSLDAPVPEYAKLVDQFLNNKESLSGRPLSKMRIGLLKETLDDGEGRMQPAVMAAFKDSLSVFKALGAELIEVDIPNLKEYCAAYYITVMSEASSNLAKYDGIRYGLRTSSEDPRAKRVMVDSRETGFGQEVKQRILLGTFALSAGYSDAYYKKAQKMRAALASNFERVFELVDALILPTAPTTAYRLGQFKENKVETYIDDLLTVPASLSGLPALSVPCGISAEDLPIGLQIVGKPLDELRLLQIGAGYDEATGWTSRLQKKLQAIKGERQAGGGGEEETASVDWTKAFEVIDE